MTHDGRDPQVDLVRRYARILRSAPAEAMRAQQRETLVEAVSAPAAALTDKRVAPSRSRARAQRSPAASSPA